MMMMSGGWTNHRKGTCHSSRSTKQDSSDGRSRLHDGDVGVNKEMNSFCMDKSKVAVGFYEMH